MLALRAHRPLGLVSIGLVRRPERDVFRHHVVPRKPRRSRKFRLRRLSADSIFPAQQGPVAQPPNAPARQVEVYNTRELYSREFAWDAKPSCGRSRRTEFE